MARFWKGVVHTKTKGEFFSWPGREVWPFSSHEKEVSQWQMKK